MSRPFFNKVTILGIGLIGASFALALKKKKICRHITGCGRKEANLKKAKGLKIIDSYELDPRKACAGSDLIVFAVPVGSFIKIARQLRGSLKKGAIITDVGSVKGKLVRDMEAILPPGASFVGCHPIAGSDRTGMDTASAGLFSGARCIITPTGKTDKKAFKKISSTWRILGAKTVILSPEEHDRIYAAISHMPHLIAYTMMNTVADAKKSYLKFAGPGFKDSTRIAASSPELWRDICIMNRKNLRKLLKIFSKNLDNLSRCLNAADARSLEKELRKAGKLREDVR